MQLPFGGSLLPDAEWSSVRPKDAFPCMQQLQSFKNARAILTELDDKSIGFLHLPRVLHAKRPEISAFALFLMHYETEIMCEVRKAVEACGGMPLSVVNDGIYVFGKSEDHLEEIFRAAATMVERSLDVVFSLKT